ncbi:nicotinate-nucleotide--dimethylbenzimidazole phosphoribosyltransferase [Granulosicoccus antarcticus]|uniref:Nicotinate-nucleotide--dimethylbenzimidazole phosphoribosyltransferase n=1 Tax=Granulosicoccus antarcticus IMCC3135 TaxID=1192854 RepID=A0A2Z2NUZ5_9GAMM|nr:nicotinate-nucleotide--dimethylbenzimidazole phosphoribosyltransferase [Granulosicoccus antarcticus]ASJ75149.1 Nicotinate-nucleotide--dimethylbenzimidazole phosphoribosyltransferase [Granulosicoccus antarcticus IMCC3135]
MLNFQGETADTVSDISADARKRLDNKTKPPGSLGQIEAVAVQLATVQGSVVPVVDPARIIVFAADHGITAAGVSAYPAEVTAQMMANFASGGAAVCVLGAAAGASLEVIDVGVNADLEQLTGVVHAKVRAGSRNLLEEAAMTHEELDSALQVGREAVVRAVEAGQKCLGLGEMGIGNTTSAAILTGLMCGASATEVTGRGTGLNNSQLSLKQRVVADAMQRHALLADDPLECLRNAGGLEIAALVGAMLEAPAHRLPVLVDGFIVTSAALIACRLKPSVRDVLFFAHQSAETGHALALRQLAAQPLLQLDMRLGEGSATALALPLLRGAAAVLCDMASFADAGVSTAE